MEKCRIFYLFLLRRTHLVRITEVDLNTCLAPGEQALLISNIRRLKGESGIKKTEIAQTSARNAEQKVVSQSRLISCPNAAAVIASRPVFIAD